MADGLLMVYTGNGCENCASPLGQAFRAVGRGLSVCVIEFVTHEHDIGPPAGDKSFNGYYECHRAPMELGGQSDDASLEQENSAKTIRLMRKVIDTGKFDIVILDRLGDLMTTGMVDTREVLALMTQRPSELNILISGRSVPDEILQAADLVTRVENVKPDSSCRSTGNDA